MRHVESEHKYNGQTLEMDSALEIMQNVYSLYYTAEDQGAEINYDWDVCAFDQLMKEDQDFCEMTTEFAMYRKDLITSDREAAAYIAALVRLHMLPADILDQRPAVVIPTTCAVDYSKYDQAAGQSVTGNGWTIDFNNSINKTIVTIVADPTGEIKKAVEAAGFWYSPTFGTYNKKFTRKAHKAALELIKTLNGAAA